MPKDNPKIYFVIANDLNIDYKKIHFEFMEPDAILNSSHTLLQVVAELREALLVGYLEKVVMHAHGKRGLLLIGEEEVHPADFIKMVTSGIDVRPNTLFEFSSCQVGTGVKSRRTNFEESSREQDLGAYDEIPEGVQVILAAGQFNTLVREDISAIAGLSDDLDSKELFLKSILDPETATIIFKEGGVTRSFKKSAPRDAFDDDSIKSFLTKSIVSLVDFYRESPAAVGRLRFDDAYVQKLLDAVNNPLFIKDYRDHQFEMEVSRGKIKYVDPLLESGADIIGMKYWGHELFCSLCSEGSLSDMEFLLNKKDDEGKYIIDLNKVNNDDVTALYLACLSNNLPAVEKILKATLDSGVPRFQINKPSKGETPFFVACELGYVDLVKILLSEKSSDGKHKVNINKSNNWGQTPFAAACSSGDLEIVKLLLEEKKYEGSLEYVVDIDRPLRNGLSPFFTACIEGKSDVVALLLEARDQTGNRRVNINAICNGTNPFIEACKGGNLKIVELLLQARNRDGSYVIEPNKIALGVGNPIIKIVKNCDSRVLDLILKSSKDRGGSAINLNEISDRGSSILNLVLKKRDPAMLQIIIKYGANINIDKPLKTILDNLQKTSTTDNAKDLNDSLKMMAILIANGASARSLKSDIERNGPLFSVVANLAANVKGLDVDKKEEALNNLFDSIDKNPEDLISRYSKLTKVSISILTGAIKPPSQAFDLIKTSPIILAGASVKKDAIVDSRMVPKSVCNPTSGARLSLMGRGHNSGISAL